VRINEELRDEKMVVSSNGIAYNQAYNQATKVVTSKNINKNNEKESSEVWLTVKEAYNLLGVSQQSVQKAVKKGKYTIKQVSGNGGEQYRILLSSLPEKAQLKYYNDKLDLTELPGVNDTTEIILQKTKTVKEQLPEKFDPDREVMIYNNSTDYNKRYYEKKSYVLEQTDCLETKKELSLWVRVYNERIEQEGLELRWSEKEIKRMTTSVRAIYRYRDERKTQGVAGMIGKYGKLKGRTTVAQWMLDVFAGYSLQNGTPSWKGAWERTKDKVFAEKGEFLNFPSLTAFRRALENEYPLTFIEYMRKGYNRWKRTFQFFIDRDYSDLKANQVWVGDHFQVDTGTYDKDGKMVRAWVTAWCDFRTLKMLAWDIHIGESNSDHIFLTFKRAVEKVGLPEAVYIDNGKDYRVRDFAGGRKVNRQFKKEDYELTEEAKRNRHRINTLLGMLQIDVIFAEPYNSQAKVIERLFGIIHGEYSRFIVGYCGRNTADRPEQLDKDRKAGNLLDYDVFKPMLEEYIEYGYNGRVQSGKILNGQSPDQLWAEMNPAITYVSKESLSLFCARMVGSYNRPLTIGRDGVRVPKTGDVYYEEWMWAHKKDKVYLRIDPDQKELAYVFDAETDKFIDIATCTNGVAALAVTEEERAHLAEMKKQKQRELKKLKQMEREIERHDAQETHRNMIERKKAEKTTLPAPEPKQINLRQTRADDIIKQKEVLAKTGSEDISAIVNVSKENAKPKKNIHVLPSERRRADRSDN